MSHEVATIKGNLNEERCFTAPLRIWEFVFLFVFAAGIIGAACWQSSKSYLSNDELVTAAILGPVSGRRVKKSTHPASANDTTGIILSARSLEPRVCATTHSMTKNKGGFSSPPCRIAFHISEKCGLETTTAVTSSSLLRYDLLDCQQAAPMIPAANTNRKTNSQILNGAVKHRSSFRFPLMVATSWLIVVQSLTRWV